MRIATDDRVALHAAVIKARIFSNPIGTLCTVAEKCMPHVRDPLSLDIEADAGFFSPVRSSWRTSVITCLRGLCPMRPVSPRRHLPGCRERIFPSRGHQSRCADPKQIATCRCLRRRWQVCTARPRIVLRSRRARPKARPADPGQRSCCLGSSATRQQSPVCCC